MKNILIEQFLFQMQRKNQPTPCNSSQFNALTNATTFVAAGKAK